MLFIFFQTTVCVNTPNLIGPSVSTRSATQTPFQFRDSASLYLHQGREENAVRCWCWQIHDVHCLGWNLADPSPPPPPRPPPPLPPLHLPTLKPKTVVQAGLFADQCEHDSSHTALLIVHRYYCKTCPSTGQKLSQAK